MHKLRKIGHACLINLDNIYQNNNMFCDIYLVKS